MHGMPLWFALKNGYARAETTVQIGLRDVDEVEKRLLRESGVRAFSMTDVDKHGMTASCSEALAIAGSATVRFTFRLIWMRSIRAKRPEPVRRSKAA